MSDRHVAAVRGFNRFYTRRIGVLDEGHLASPFSLTEVRVLYELAHRDGMTASELVKDLGLDAGYLSRILLKLRRRGMLARTRSGKDGRQSHLVLTTRGRKAFAPLDRAASRQVAAMLDALPAGERARLVEAMETIEH